MRTAVRTSIVTAALAGALLAPAAAGAAGAFAAPAGAHGATSVYGTVSDNDRYAGEPVYIGGGLVAVLRNKAEGPEAWIRFAGSQWKPGDAYMAHLLTVLNRTHLSDTANGLLLSLTGADTSAPVLTVTKDGATASYPLPKAGTPEAPAAAPEAPAKPAPENPKSPEAPEAPKTPKTPTAPTAPTAPTSTVTDRNDGAVVLGADVKPQTVAQTVVVPQGAVAAGAEISAEDTDNSTTLAAGGGLIAILAALGAARIARSRAARDRA
ncbi:hypothetical protein [Streptomyces sp. NPDC090445]|uniref:hypothetical protein n=1 Tax=Streptomyces sp. NPDC090445 TaxID=3365963 RepID=UPI003808CFFC